MGRVLKYISVFGGVQGLNVLFSIVRNKLTSVLLGVGGVGLIDVYSRTADLIGSSTNFGLSFSAVQHIAELYGKVDPADVVDPTVAVDDEGNLIESAPETDIVEGVEDAIEEIAITDDEIAQKKVEVAKNDDKTTYLPNED